MAGPQWQLNVTVFSTSYILRTSKSTNSAVLTTVSVIAATVLGFTAMQELGIEIGMAEEPRI